ncbi:MAG: hypothetical protein ABIR50_07925 [Ginsengibacter sp.]
MKKILFIAILFFVSEMSFSQAKTKSENLKSSAKIETKATISQKVFSPLNIANVYTFIGNGNWSDINNWDSNGIPLGITSPGSEIRIHSTIPGAKCVLDVPYIVDAGTNPTKLIIYPGNNLVVIDLTVY